MRKVLASLVALALTGGAAFATELKIEIDGEAKGVVTIDLLEEVAPGHVARITDLAKSGAYDGVVFHRVIEGFMAQTGDVQYGNMNAADFNMGRAGGGASKFPNLKAEFSQIPYEKGVVGMARRGDSNSANAQFFIMFAPAPHLTGGYTVIGRVTEGMDVVDKIKRGHPRSGRITGQPDVMKKVTVIEK